MNNEIKEILDKLQKKKQVFEYHIKNNSAFNDDEYEAQILLDYITNLQKENKHLERKLDSALEDFENWLKGILGE